MNEIKFAKMEKETSSKDTSSTSSVSMENNSSASYGSLKYVRKVSSNLVRRPKKITDSFLKVTRREKRKSVSANDVTSVDRNDTPIEIPNFSKVRSLPRDGEIRSSTSYYELIGSDSMESAKSCAMPFEEPLTSDDELVLASKGRSYSITYNNFSYLNTISKDTNMQPTSGIDIIKEELAKCKQDFEDLKVNLDSFKKEFREGIENLRSLIKDDEIRYTKLCYQLHNVTDLHQTQLQYLHSLIGNMEGDNNKKQDECVLDMLFEKLNMLETRIVKL